MSNASRLVPGSNTLLTIDLSDPDRLEGLTYDELGGSVEEFDSVGNPWANGPLTGGMFSPDGGDSGIGNPDPVTPEDEMTDEERFNAALEQYWKDNPEALAEAVESNPEAFGSTTGGSTAPTPGTADDIPGWAEVLQGIVEGSTGVGKSADDLMADWIGGWGVGARYNLPTGGGADWRGTVQDLLVGSLPGPLTTSPIILEDVLSDIASGVEGVLNNETTIAEAIQNAGENVVSRVQDTIGGTIDNASDILSGVGEAIGGLVDYVSSEGTSEFSDINDDTVDDDTTSDIPVTSEEETPTRNGMNEEGGQVTEPTEVTDPADTPEINNAVLGTNDPNIDPRTGERYLPEMTAPSQNGMGLDGLQTQRNTLDEPEYLSTDDINITDSSAPAASGGGGGGGLLSSDPDQFMTSLLFDFPVLNRVRAPQRRRIGLMTG